MKVKEDKIKYKLESVFTNFSSYFIPIFQFVPCTRIWFGIMSVPIVAYIIFFFQYPGILIYDIRFLISVHGSYIILAGFFLYLYALIYQLTHRKQLLDKGPYKYIRHPQYLSFIIMSLGMTIVAFQTTPIINFTETLLNGYVILLYIWIGEVLAYIILGKIEEISLKSKYGVAYLEYRTKVPFMFPFPNFSKNESEEN